MVNFNILKKLVSELEKSLTISDNIADTKADVVDYIAELARAVGLASIITQEGGMLIKDITTYFNFSGRNFSFRKRYFG